MATLRQSNCYDEKCTGVNTDASLKPTNLYHSENTTESDEKEITNELDPDKYVMYCTTCHLQLSRTDKEQHKRHQVDTLKKAAADARKRLKDLNKTVQMESKACLDKIKDYEDKRLTAGDLYSVIDSEFDRISKALNDSVESVKKQREMDYNSFLQGLEKTKSSLEQNVEIITTNQREAAKLPDSDLLSKEESLTKELHNFQKTLNVPLFDLEGESVENSLIQVVYSQKGKEKIKQKEKEHEQLRIEREYFENAFESVMSFVNSLVKYRERNEEKNDNIKNCNLPKVPHQIKKSLKKETKIRHTAAIDNLNSLKNIAVDLSETLEKLGQIEMERTYFEQLLHCSFTWLHLLLESDGKSEIEMTLPKVPKLHDERRVQDLNQDSNNKHDVLKNIKNLLDEKQKISKESRKLKQMELEKNYFENVFKEILTSLTSTLESGQNIRIKLPKVPELKDGTKCQEMKEERKKAKDKLKEIFTTYNKSDLKKLKNKLLEVEEKADRAVIEREKTLIRLSEIAGSRLREKNPMIADLSDDYRPTKLAERHSELYDNEWTDAFLIITKTLKMSDILAIEVLLKLLKDIYHTCSEIAQKQLNVMMCPMNFEESEEEIKIPGLLNKVKEIQKKLAPDMMIFVEEVIKTKTKKTKERQFGKELDLCQPYIHSCINLCWMMNVQDPPVVLIFKEKNGEKFNPTLYKPYTRRGKYTDYMVWPAMLLHEKGPLLQKGVVQPK